MTIETIDCLNQVQACAIRVAQLYPSGVPAVGTTNLIVSDSLIELTAEPVYQEDTEHQQKNACGDLCLDYRKRGQLRYYNVAVRVCKPDPYLMQALAGGVLLEEGTATGWASPQIGEDAVPNGVSIELWARRVDAQGEDDATYPWARWILPRVYLRHGARTFADAPLDAQFGGYAKKNANWYNGPVNTDPWTEISDRPIAFIPVNSKPTAQCGPQALLAS